MHFIAPEDFGVNLVRNTPDGELHAQRHFDLCRALDMTKLSIVLDEMVRTGFLSHHQSEAFRAQAGGLLATILAENARGFIGSPQQSSSEKTRTYGLLGNNPRRKIAVIAGPYGLSDAPWNYFESRPHQHQLVVIVGEWVHGQPTLEAAQYDGINFWTDAGGRHNVNTWAWLDAAKAKHIQATCHSGPKEIPHLLIEYRPRKESAE